MSQAALIVPGAPPLETAALLYSVPLLTSRPKSVHLVFIFHSGVHPAEYRDASASAAAGSVADALIGIVWRGQTRAVPAPTLRTVSQWLCPCVLESRVPASCGFRGAVVYPSIHRAVTTWDATQERRSAPPASVFRGDSGNSSGAGASPRFPSFPMAVIFDPECVEHAGVLAVTVRKEPVRAGWVRCWMKELLRGAAERAIHYLEELDDRRVAPTPEAIDRLAELGGPLPEKPTDPEMVLGLLDDIGSRAAELSRRARGVEVWAALRSLGREGLADLVERSCRYAARFAEGLTAAGYQILNEVVLNQVLVSFGDPETTRRVIAGIQAEGTCWCGGTVWHGQTAMRTSVSSWATTAEDIERSLDAIVRVAAEQGAAR